jgi:hypothetical protein
MGERNCVWAFDEEERGILWRATVHFSELRELLGRARKDEDDEGMWLVTATEEELDEMYTLVDALMDRTRNRKRFYRLDGTLAGLAMAMDGF